MDAAKQTSQEEAKADAQENLQATTTHSKDSKIVWIDPDLDFIQTISKNGGNFYKKCMQCGTCSATCSLSPDIKPFPGKEMAWAAWGMKDRLINDLDIWLCYQCNDCSTRCPRGARPGDVLSAIRQQSIAHYSFPTFLGRWVNSPQYIPFLLGIPALLLAIVLTLKVPIENALNITKNTGTDIVYSYSSIFPHWLLNSFFLLISLLVLFIVIAGVMRFWRGMKISASDDTPLIPVKGIFPSIVTVIKNVFTHDKFTECDKMQSRFWSHICVFFGFLALCLVTIWVITAQINPLIRGEFIYPFGFWNPWKMLANLGGGAIIVGCLLMIYDRFKKNTNSGSGAFFDWSLITMLMIVVLSGFITEVLHYVRLEPHRHIAYFGHLLFVCALFMYLPYSKFAHLVYRTTALVFAEYSGREITEQSQEGDR